MRDPERRWSYVVFLQTLGKYLEYRVELGLVDVDYHYARQSLLHYATWMAVHECPNLERRETLEFPTETWAAQDIRKAAVLEFAAHNTHDATQASTFMTRAAFFFEYAVSTLDASPTRALTRPLVLLLAYAFQRPSLDADEIPPSPLGDTDYGRPCRFVAYKARLKRKALICGGVCVTASVLTILAWFNS